MSSLTWNYTQRGQPLAGIRNKHASPPLQSHAAFGLRRWLRRSESSASMLRAIKPTTAAARLNSFQTRRAGYVAGQDRLAEVEIGDGSSDATCPSPCRPS